METLQQLDRQWQACIADSPYGRRVAVPGERDRYWNEQAKEYDDRMDQDDRRIRDVLAGLAQRGFLNKSARVLDLGCGTGVYSLPLAKCCQSVVGLDLSAEMGKRLCQKAREQGIENLRFLQADWDTLDLHKEGLEKGFDLVMSGLDPGINSLAALKKMCAASRQGCCLVTFDGPAENPTQQDLARLLYGRKPRQMVSGYNTEWPLRLLRGLGYKPERAKTAMAWTKTHTEQAAFQRLLSDHAAAFKDHPERIEALKGYIHCHLDEDGMFREHNGVPLGILYWRVDA